MEETYIPVSKRLTPLTVFRTAAQSRNFHISTSNKNPQNQGFLLEETYVPVSNRFAPLTFA
ncbi:hypothetical protein FC98_GL001559 [Lentilactobacillus kisonensis DSM 19906 = JCM 15041]|uniref:Uncharacterized protein n=1 Tax=Lentilactobacillus kisonensis DSM 19906 = JCM 15041 TaxID=1423766 RepID=A0A0R1NJ74_9LACO|nr:hypothetical protein FC98_GL001559 [Lentilactobacillus kisonensis DSM 19906 = JCM 15041]